MRKACFLAPARIWVFSARELLSLPIVAENDEKQLYYPLERVDPPHSTKMRLTGGFRIRIWGQMEVDQRLGGLTAGDNPGSQKTCLGQERKHYMARGPAVVWRQGFSIADPHQRDWGRLVSPGVCSNLYGLREIHMIFALPFSPVAGRFCFGFAKQQLRFRVCVRYERIGCGCKKFDMVLSRLASAHAPPDCNSLTRILNRGNLQVGCNSRGRRISPYSLLSCSSCVRFAGVHHTAPPISCPSVSSEGPRVPSSSSPSAVVMKGPIPGARAGCWRLRFSLR
jgi:hypothetical protein